MSTLTFARQEHDAALDAYRRAADAADAAAARTAWDHCDATRKALDDAIVAEISVSARDSARQTINAGRQTDPALRDAFDPRSKTTEYVAMCPGAMFRADELYTTDAATTYSSYLFQNALYNQVWEHLNAASAVLEAGPLVITTQDHLKPVDIPILLADASAAQTAELSAATQTYPVYDKVTLNAYRQDGFFLFSEEMRAASDFNLENLLASAAMRAIGTQCAALWATGAGTTTVAGIDTCTCSTTAASQTVITADEVVETFMDLPRPYHRNAKCIMSTGAFEQALKWKNGAGDYLLRTQENGVFSFMGRPLLVEPALADPAHSTVPVVWGDFAQGYAVRLSPVNFEIDKSGFFTNYVLTARFAQWIDGQIVDAQALRGLQMA